MSRVVLLTAALGYLVGAAAIFAGRSLRSRIGGVVAMAVPGVLLLGLAASEGGVGALLGLLAASTLAGLTAFAVWLERRAAHLDEEGLGLDRDPLRWD